MDIKKIKSRDLERLSVSEFKSEEKIPVVIVLDNVRSGHNVGSFFRTADGFRLEKILLGGITPTPPNKEISKAALGSIDTVEWEHIEDLQPLILGYKHKGYQILSIEQCTGSKVLGNQTFAKNPIVLIFGNEVKGVSQDLIDLSDAAVEIPMFGTKHSFNVSISGGIVIWEAVKVHL